MLHLFAAVPTIFLFKINSCAVGALFEWAFVHLASSPFLGGFADGCEPFVLVGVARIALGVAQQCHGADFDIAFARHHLLVVDLLDGCVEVGSGTSQLKPGARPVALPDAVLAHFPDA